MKKVVLIVFICAVAFTVLFGKKKEPKRQEVETTEVRTEAETLGIADVKVQCRALTMIFVKNILEEKWQMLAEFEITDMDLNENGDGIIEVLYMPSGATKVNLVITKTGARYEVTEAMLGGLYEVHMGAIKSSDKVLIDK